MSVINLVKHNLNPFSEVSIQARVRFEKLSAVDQMITSLAVTILAATGVGLILCNPLFNYLSRKFNMIEKASWTIRNLPGLNPEPLNRTVLLDLSGYLKTSAFQKISSPEVESLANNTIDTCVIYLGLESDNRRALIACDGTISNKVIDPLIEKKISPLVILECEDKEQIADLESRFGAYKDRIRWYAYSPRSKLFGYSDERKVKQIISEFQAERSQAFA